MIHFEFKKIMTKHFSHKSHSIGAHEEQVMVKIKLKKGHFLYLTITCKTWFIILIISTWLHPSKSLQTNQYQLNVTLLQLKWQSHHETTLQWYLKEK